MSPGFERVFLTDQARADINAINDPDVRLAVVTALVEIENDLENDLEYGRRLETKAYTGDLRGCRKVYVDKPLYRLVYWCSPDERQPRKARILAIGERAASTIYKTAVGRYNVDRQAAGQSDVEAMTDEQLGL